MLVGTLASAMWATTRGSPSSSPPKHLGKHVTEVDADAGHTEGPSTEGPSTEGAPTERTSHKRKGDTSRSHATHSFVTLSHIGPRHIVHFATPLVGQHLVRLLNRLELLFIATRTIWMKFLGQILVRATNLFVTRITAHS